jgi:hypothetical protein
VQVRTDVAVWFTDPLVCIAFCARIALAVIFCASSHKLHGLATDRVCSARAVDSGSVDNADPFVAVAASEVGALTVVACTSGLGWYYSLGVRTVYCARGLM